MNALLAVIIAGAIAVFMFGFLVAASFNVGWGLSIGESASLFVAAAAFLFQHIRRTQPDYIIDLRLNQKSQ